MSLTRAAFDALVATDPETLYALFQQQAAQLAALTARVGHLEAQLGGHSQNSHRPPASEGRASRRAASGPRAARRRAGNRGIRGTRWR